MVNNLTPEIPVRLNINWTFEVAELDEVGVLCVSDCDDCVDFLDQLLLLIVFVVLEPFCQTSLSGAILNQNETNHGAEVV